MIENRIRLQDLDGIKDNREKRFRTKLDMDFVSKLAKQIKDHRLLNPIIVDDAGVLIAGENRLAAFRYLRDLRIPCDWEEYKDWTKIPIRVAKKLTEYDKQIIELSENLGRNDMTWQDKANGLFKIFSSMPDEEQNRVRMAASLNMSSNILTIYIALAKAMDDPAIANADNYRTAYNILVRKKEREVSSIMDDIPRTTPAKGVGTEEEILPLDLSLADQELQNSPTPELNPPKETKGNTSPFQGKAWDFIQWVQEYQGPLFNLIHFDPPYGINLHKSNTMQKSGRSQYEDTKDVFHEITNALLKNQDHFISQSAHILFWHSAPDRELVKQMLEEHGWKVWKYPLVWHKSDNTGLFPDPQRGPRHTYEMATLASRGDRKIVSLVSDSHSSPATKSSGHESEKPTGMLEHFFKMLVDSSTTIFDPTGGSGNAILAAKNLGAKSGLFLEIEEYYPRKFNEQEAGEEDEKGHD